MNGTIYRTLAFVSFLLDGCARETMRRWRCSWAHKTMETCLKYDYWLLLLLCICLFPSLFRMVHFALCMIYVDEFNWINFVRQSNGIVNSYAGKVCAQWTAKGQDSVYFMIFTFWDVVDVNGRYILGIASLLITI